MIYILYVSWLQVVYTKNTRGVVELLIKHKAKLSALLASRQQAGCFILRITRYRLCFNCYKALACECLIKAYLVQSIILCKSFSEQAFFWLNELGYTVLFHCLQYILHTLPH